MLVHTQNFLLGGITKMKTEQEQIEEMMLAVPQKIVAYDSNPKGQHLYGEQRSQIAEELIKAGYGDVSEYKAEIERLTHIIEYCENEELVKSKVKQAQINVLNKIKEKCSYTFTGKKLIAESDIDELIKEIE